MATTLGVAGCDTGPNGPAPVSLVLTSGHDRPTALAVAPRYVEVRHEEEGWLRYGVVAEIDQAAVERGELVQLGEAELPDGRYDAVRIGYLEAVQRGATDTDPGQTSIVQDDVWVMRPFCVDGRSEAELVFQIFADHPSAGVGGPTFKVLSAPECDA